MTKNLIRLFFFMCVSLMITCKPDVSTKEVKSKAVTEDPVAELPKKKIHLFLFVLRSL